MREGGTVDGSAVPRAEGEEVGLCKDPPGSRPADLVQAKMVLSGGGGGSMYVLKDRVFNVKW